MSINLQQHVNLMTALTNATSRVQMLRELKNRIDSFDVSIDNAKMAEVHSGLDVWTIQKREREVAEALDELSDKLSDVICVIELAERKAEREADWYYRELQRKVFNAEGDKG